MSSPLSGSSARAYLGIGLAVLEEKRRLLLHSPVAGGVVDNTVLIVGVGSTWRHGKPSLAGAQLFMLGASEREKANAPAGFTACPHVISSPLISDERPALEG
jgi:hypothetical protein